MIESPCFKDAHDPKRTMSCFSCHTLHQLAGDSRPIKEWANDQLGPGMDGNKACAQCHEKLAATVACKAAIKAGDELSQGEMRALFVALGDAKLPAHDVHGRSTIVHLSWDELERRFGRR